jgi:hypothetical protein
MVMKKLGFCLVLLVLGASLLAQSNNELQKFTGNWKGILYSPAFQETSTVTASFNSNGTYVMTEKNSSGLTVEYKGNFTVSNSKITLVDSGKNSNSYDYVFSTNGKIMVLSMTPLSIYVLEKQ